MPKKKGKLQAKAPKFSLRASGKKNSEHHELGLRYSAADRSGSHTLRDLKQVSYPELCGWGPKVCKAYLWDHGVLSPDVPLCWSCGESMIRTGRRVDDELKCGGTNCYGHPVLTRPLEAFTRCIAQFVKERKLIMSISCDVVTASGSELLRMQWNICCPVCAEKS